MAIAAVFAWIMIDKWGSVSIEQVNGERKLTMHPNFGIYYLIYLIVAVVVGIWQFILFSQKF